MNIFNRIVVIFRNICMTSEERVDNDLEIYVRLLEKTDMDTGLFFITGTVLQVLVNIPEHNSGILICLKSDSIMKVPDVVFVECDTKKYHDNDKIKNLEVVYKGQFSYKSVSQRMSRIRCYTVKKED